MKEDKKFDLKTILIVVLIIVILLMRMCQPGSQTPQTPIKIDGKNYNIVKRVVDTQYVKTTQTIYKDGKTIYVEKPIYINVPHNVDTNLILKDYFTKFTYKDTLTLKDSLGYVTITDTIFKNKILNRNFVANINKIKITDIIYVKPEPKNEFYLGGVTGLDKVNLVNFVGPSLMLKTKKDKVFVAGIGYSNGGNVSVQVGMYWKLNNKK